MALKWLLSRGDDIVPIPGTSKPHRLEENLNTLKISVNADHLDELGEAVDYRKVSGTRYPAARMKDLGL